MYKDNSLIPTEAVRLAALGMLAERPRSYAELAEEVRHFTGRIAVSSAYVKAPASDSNPAAIHTNITHFGSPTLHVIARAFRKTPVPITFPIMTDTAAISPRPRMRACLSVISGCIFLPDMTATYYAKTACL